MTNEGERPRSSWQSWVRSSAGRRSAPPEPPAATPPPPSDLDLDLEWSEGSAPAPAATEGLDAGLSWEPAITGEVPVVADAAAEPVVEEAPAEVVDDATEYAEEVDEEADEESEAEDDDAGELLPAVPLLPSIAGRVEALSGLLRSISMRVDGLTAVTDVYRANVTDRIDEYTETVLQLSRQSDQALDEHRRGTERAIGELRRTASDRGEAVGQLVSRVEELATDMATLRDLIEVLIDTMPASAEGSGAAPLTRADLDDSVDTIADAVVARIDTNAIVEAVVARMEQAFEVVGDPAPTPPPPPPAPPSAAELLDAGLASIDAPIESPPPAKRGGRVRRGK